MLKVKGLLFSICILSVGFATRAYGAEAIIQSAQSQNTTKDISNEASQFKKEGIRNYSSGFYSEALVSFSKGYDLYAQAEDMAGMSACLNNAALAAKELGQYAHALDLLEKAFHIDSLRADTAGLAIVTHNIGEIHHLRYNYIVALHYYSLSLQYELSIGNITGAGDCYLNTGALLEENGLFDEAMHYYREAMLCYASESGTGQPAKCLNNMGVAATRLGHYYDALNFFETSLYIKNNTGDIQGKATTLINLGNLMVLTGDTVKARICFNEAILIALSEESPLVKDSLLNSGVFTSFDDIFYYWISLYIENGYGFLVPQNLFFKGYVHYNTGDYQSAVNCFTNSLELAEFYDIKPLCRDNYKYLLGSYTKLRQYEKAAACASRYMELSETLYAQGLLDFLKIKNGKTSPLFDSDNYTPDSTNQIRSRQIPPVVTTGMVLVIISISIWFFGKRK